MQQTCSLCFIAVFVGGWHNASALVAQLEENVRWEGSARCVDDIVNIIKTDSR